MHGSCAFHQFLNRDIIYSLGRNSYHRSTNPWGTMWLITIMFYSYRKRKKKKKRERERSACGDCVALTRISSFALLTFFTLSLVSLPFNLLFGFFFLFQALNFSVYCCCSNGVVVDVVFVVAFVVVVVVVLFCFYRHRQ